MCYWTAIGNHIGHVWSDSKQFVWLYCMAIITGKQRNAWSWWCHDMASFSLNNSTAKASDIRKARFMGPAWGPSGADRTQVGPRLAPWTLLSGIAIHLIACTSQRRGVMFSSVHIVQRIMLKVRTLSLSLWFGNYGFIHNHQNYKAPQTPVYIIQKNVSIGSFQSP